MQKRNSGSKDLLHLETVQRTAVLVDALVAGHEVVVARARGAEERVQQALVGKTQCERGRRVTERDAVGVGVGEGSTDPEAERARPREDSCGKALVESRVERGRGGRVEGRKREGM
eukprot:202109-Rhodomonas_salina.1